MSMNAAVWVGVVLLLFVVDGFAQQSDTVGSTPGPTLTVRSTVVLVPALVKTKKGDVVFSLTADDFSLTDNGVAQRLTLDPDTDAEPLALAICVERRGGQESSGGLR